MEGLAGIVDAETVVTTVGGSGGGGPMGGGGPSGPEAGRVTLGMADYQERRFDVFATLAEMQETIGRDLAGAEVRVDKVSEGPPSGPPVNIEISGEDPDRLEALAAEAVDLIERSVVYPRLVGLESDMEDARPELRVEVDREKASLYGLSTNEVGFLVRGAINGLEAAKYRTGNDEYDIIVRLREEDRRELTSLADLTVFTEGRQVPLLSVAEWVRRQGLQLDSAQGHGSDGDDQRRGGGRLQQQRGAPGGGDRACRLHGRASGRIHAVVHRGTGGAAGGDGVPDRCLPRGPHC